MSEQPVNTTVTIKILGKEYQVSCPEDEVDALSASARFVDQQMSNIRESGRVFGHDRIAVMAALNIANDFIHKRNTADTMQSDIDSKLAALTRRVSQVLTEHKQLNL